MTEPGKTRQPAEIREIRCPADGSLVATVSEAGPEDAERAIAAARRAFDNGPWPSTSSLERSALLHRVADLLERDKNEVARLESLDTCKRLVESLYDVDDIVGVFRYFAGLAGAESGRVVDTGRPNVVSRVVQEPVGVCSPSRHGRAQVVPPFVYLVPAIALFGATRFTAIVGIAIVALAIMLDRMAQGTSARRARTGKQSPLSQIFG